MKEISKKKIEAIRGLGYLDEAFPLLNYVSENPGSNLHQITQAMDKIASYLMPSHSGDAVKENYVKKHLESLERKGLVKSTAEQNKPVVFSISDRFAVSFSEMAAYSEEAYINYISRLKVTLRREEVVTLTKKELEDAKFILGDEERVKVLRRLSESEKEFDQLCRGIGSRAVVDDVLHELMEKHIVDFEFKMADKGLENPAHFRAVKTFRIEEKFTDLIKKLKL